MKVIWIRPANFAKSASFSIKVFAFKLIVLLSSDLLIPSKIDLLNSFSISPAEIHKSSPMDANSIRERKSAPSHKKVVPSGFATTTIPSVGSVGAKETSPRALRSL